VNVPQLRLRSEKLDDDDDDDDNNNNNNDNNNNNKFGIILFPSGLYGRYHNLFIIRQKISPFLLAVLPTNILQSSSLSNAQ